MVKQIGIFYNLVFFKFGISKKYLVFYYLDLAFFIFWYFKVLVFSGSAENILNACFMLLKFAAQFNVKTS